MKMNEWNINFLITQHPSFPTVLTVFICVVFHWWGYSFLTINLFLKRHFVYFVFSFNSFSKLNLPCTFTLLSRKMHLESPVGDLSWINIQMGTQLSCLYRILHILENRTRWEEVNMILVEFLVLIYIKILYIICF